MRESARAISVFMLTAFLVTAPLPSGIAAGAEEAASKRLEKILGDFESYAVKAMADWRVPGMAIAITRDDDVIYQKAFGVKELGRDDPVTTDTVFQIGSTSKAFTSAIVATLVDEGRLKWDDKVSGLLGDFRMYDPWVTAEFTVTDLMAQRSGMPAHGADSLVMVGYGRDRVIDSLRYVKPATSFRSAFAYQNNLWLVAAKIVEKLTGESWEDNIRSRIFRPLGMSSSSTGMKSYTRGADVAALHHDVDGIIVVLPMDWPYIDWTYTYGPAGGINSSVKDVSKWLRMHAQNGIFKGNRVIKEESAVFMHSPKTVCAGATDPNQYYCLGWIHREANPHPIVWHNGGTSGSKTMIAFVPEEKLGIVVLSNLIDNMMPESLAWRFFDAYFGNPKRDWSKEALEAARKERAKQKAERSARGEPPAPATELDRYAGDYTSDIYGTVTVAKKDSSLALTIGPKRVRIDLKPWDGDKFAASWKYFILREDIGFVTFKPGAEGAVREMVVDAFNEDGTGSFRKAEPPAVTAGAPESIIKSSPAGEFDKLFKEAVAVNGVKTITYDQFMRLRNSPAKFFLVDVLSSDDYNTGHIPGAISFPVKNINFYNSVNKIPMGSDIVVYCLDNRCTYSDEAARKLTGYGYRVLAYKGGLDEWQQKGNALKR